jgi:hypothetical protein
VYYYIYGSVVAALSRPADNNCDQAMRTMGEVQAELEANPDDYADGRDTIIGIVAAAEEICASLNSGTPLPDSSIPTQVGTEVGEQMDESTPTPGP